MLPVAHRAPASAASCIALAEAGARCFEVDVMLSSSGLVVSHWLPAPGLHGLVEHNGARLRLHRQRSPDPLLTEVLSCIPVAADVLLDPKETAAPRRAEMRRQLANQLLDRERFVVSTHDTRDLEEYQAAGFRTWRTVGTKRQLADALSGVGDSHQGLSIQHALLTVATTERLLGQSPLLVAWTVNAVERARQLAELGVRGITTDNPEVLRWAAGQP